jgi:hypothetical protein
MRTRLIRSWEEMPEINDDEEEDAGGMFIEKEDIQLIYNALRDYKPTDEEAALHSALLESFDEMLVVDYDVPFPDAN